VVSFTEHFNHVKELGSDYAVTEMGVYYRDFEKETLKSGMILPSYPASRDLCAMGGIVNNNSAGEKKLRFGKTDEYVREISMVCADGNLYNFKEETEEEWRNICDTDKSFFGDIHRNIDSILRKEKEEIVKNKPTVSKNSSGYYLWKVYDEKRNVYNLAKLICGAQGTLGMVIDAKLGLVKKEDFSRMLVVFIKKVGYIPDIVSEVMPLAPESFELYDDHTFKIAIRFWFDIAKKMGGNLFSLAVQFIPEFMMVLTGGVPKVVLLAEFTGSSQEEVDEKVELGYEKIKAKFENQKDVSIHLVAKNEAKKYWTFRRESFNLLRSKLSDMRTAPFIEDVVIHRDDFPTFFPEFEKLLDEYKLVYTIAGHVGDGNLHVIPLMKLSEEKNIETIKELSGKVYALVEKYKGSISGEHNDGLIRTPFLHYMFTPRMLELFQEVKNTFDPLGIFNPHKKVGVSWDYALKRIDRSI
jgi:FAD/FMN-containing dehydrogenase